MILFYDCETSGLPDFNKRASDPTQPHIVQLAAILTEDDGTEVDGLNSVVRPDGWMIPKEASDIHGITHEVALKVGTSEKYVAENLLEMIRRVSLNVGHNFKFDKFIARIALRRFGLLSDDQDTWWKELPTFCTMQKMTAICRLPGRYGNFKWPKLTEAYQHAFGKTFDGAHDALADVRATKDIYFWLKGQDAA